jgi:hypothetical protein
MATCKDCVHCDVCDMPIITDGRKNASNCKKFKNKADFVEVVRCKDCRRRYTHCFDQVLDDEDFCSYGERKET